MSSNDTPLNPNGESDVATLLGDRKAPGATAAARPRLRPGYLMGAGTTGVRILRRVKQHLRSRGIADLFRIHVVDSDSREATRACGLPPLTDREFNLLGVKQMEDVLKNPEFHRDLLARLDLDDNDVRKQFVTRVGDIENPLRGCGQMRPFGALRFCADYPRVVGRIDEDARELNGLWASLEHEIQGLPAEQQHEARLPVWLVTGGAGGTGSSIAIDLAIAAKARIPNASLRLVILLPTVYDPKLTLDERNQVRANAIAFLRELDFVQQGEARDAGMVFNYLQAAATDAPDTLFSECYLIERIDAGNGDLKDPERVYDAVALALLTEIGLTIGESIRADMTNHQAINLAEPCHETHLPRAYSTLGATALSIPKDATVRYLALRNLDEVLRRHSTAPASGAGTAGDDGSITWLATEGLAKPNGGDVGIMRRVWDGIDPRIEQRIDGRLFIGRGAKRRYHRNKGFVDRYEAFLAEWPGDHDLGFLRSEATKLAGSLECSLGEKLAAAVLAEVRRAGAQAGRNFAVAVGAGLKAAKQAAAHARVLDEQRAPEDFAGAKSVALSLVGKVKRHFRSRSAQEDVRASLLSACTHEVRSVVVNETERLLGALQGKAETHAKNLALAVEKVTTERTSLRNRVHEVRAQLLGAFAETSMEVNLLGAGLLDDLYPVEQARHGEALGAADAELSSRFVAGTTPKDFTNPLAESCLKDARAALDNVNVASLLAEHLRDPERRDHARALLSETLRKCRPLWDARSPAAQQFPESIVVGVPAARDSAAWSEIAEVVHAVEPRMQLEGYAAADVALVTCEDPHRIYVTRRSHGARPHYLSSVVGAMKHYNRRRRQPGSLSLHTFPKAFVERMAPIVQDHHVEGRRMFALALAFGLLNQRSTCYYLNVRRVGNGLETAIFPANDSVLFHDGAPRPDSEVRRIVEAQGIFALKNGSVRPELLLAQGREAAANRLGERADDLRVLRELMGRVVTAAGKVRVADEIEHFSAEANGALQPDERDVLAIEVEQLRNP